MDRNKKTRILFGAYCILLIWIVLLKTSFSLSDLAVLRGIRSVNLIPFHYSQEAPFHKTETILNVFLFVPLGIYLKMLDTRSWKALLLGFAISLLPELSQFVWQLGASDITDLITNTAGTGIGILAYFLLQRILGEKDRTDRLLRAVATAATVVFFLLAIVLLAANRQ